AGLTIIFTKPFRVGEYVEIVGVRGDVAAIELFSTTLVHADRSRVVIPNRKLVGEILHNFGNTRQLHLTITVPHAADVTAALTAALVAHLRGALDAPALELAEPPSPLSGGFDTEIVTLRLRGGPPAFARPLVLRVLRPHHAPAMVLREQTVQNTVADQGYP